MKKFAISDLHGCRKTFNAFLNSVNFSTSDELFILGDVVDRGPDSKGIIDDIIKMRSEGYFINMTKGNHEDLMINSYKGINRNYQDVWMGNGAFQTLESYGLNKDLDWKTIVPKEHLDFLESLPVQIVLENMILVHAGLDFYKKNPLLETSNEDKIWIRDERFSAESIDNKFLIVGHTPQSKEQIVERIKTGSKKIMIDNGCAFSKSPGYGHLCYLDLDSFEIRFEKNIDN